jgi:hypothetical protein
MSRMAQHERRPRAALTVVGCAGPVLALGALVPPAAHRFLALRESDPTAPQHLLEIQRGLARLRLQHEVLSAARAPPAVGPWGAEQHRPARRRPCTLPRTADIEETWVLQPLTVAGKWRARRLNKIEYHRARRLNHHRFCFGYSPSRRGRAPSRPRSGARSPCMQSVPRRLCPHTRPHRRGCPSSGRCRRHQCRC